MDQKKPNLCVSSSARGKKKHAKRKPIKQTLEVSTPLSRHQDVKMKKQVEVQSTELKDSVLLMRRDQKITSEESKEYQRISRLSSPQFIKGVSNYVVGAIEKYGIKGAWRDRSFEKRKHSHQKIPSLDSFLFLNKTFSFSDTLPKIEFDNKHQSNIQKTKHQMDVFVPMNQSASFVYPLVYPTLNGYYSMFVPTPVQKQYEDFIVYEQHILSDLRTTIYVRHIPNKYTLKMLEEEIDRTHKNRYNFLHLPFDYENNCNRGYAFINFAKRKNLRSFYATYHGKKWRSFKSEKICEIKYACIQGKTALIEHFYNTKVFKHVDDKYRPIFRDTESEIDSSDQQDDNQKSKS